MRILIYLIAVSMAVTGLLASGCSSTSQSIYAHRLMYKEFTLSARRPFNKEFGVHLISVEPDQTTRIRSEEYQEVLEAKPGDFFPPPGFGHSGLKLISASPKKQKAKFGRTWCE